MPTTTDYNGWKNRDTWLAALWLGNSENAYHEATRIVAEDWPPEVTYSALREVAEWVVGDPFTPENVDWAAVAAAFGPDA